MSTPSSPWIPAILHAQAIEGWHAPAGFRAHLDQVARGGMVPENLIARSADECLQASRRHQPRPKPFHRRILPPRPYEDPRYPVLRNLPGINAAGPLQDFEAQACATRTLAFLGNLRHAQGTRARLGRITRAEQILVVHRYLFGDVYGWAGKARTVGITKGGVGFAPPDDIATHLERAADALSLHRVDGPAEHLATFLAEFLWAHPFRDGNGRTATAVLMSLTGPGSLLTVDTERWFSASAASLAGEDEPDPRPWIPIVEAMIQTQRQERQP